MTYNIRPLTPGHMLRLKVAMGEGTHTIPVTYSGTPQVLRNKAISYVPAEFLVGATGELADWDTRFNPDGSQRWTVHEERDE